MRYLNLFLLVLAMVGFSPPAAALPDLTGTVEGPEYAPIPNADGSVTLSFEVQLKNIGSEACPGQWFGDFWATYPCECDVPPMQCPNLLGSESWDSDKDFPPLEPGVPWSPGTISKNVFPSPQPHRYLLFVDSVFNFCTEEDETNNIICDEYPLLPEVLDADLDLSKCSVEVDPDNPANALFTIDVTNMGTKETPEPTHVDFFLEDLGTKPDCEDYWFQDGDTFAVVPAGLLPGETITVSATLADVDPGTYVVYSIVNSYQEIVESEWVNNCCNFNMKPYTHPEFYFSPDLIITEFSVQKADAYENYFKYYGTITNQGFIAVEITQPFKIGIFHNKPGGPALDEPCPDVTAGEGVVLTWPSPQDPLILDVGDEWSFSGTAGWLDNGFYEVWAVVDCDQDVLELEEKNNEAKFDLLVNADGPDLWVKEFSAEQKEVDGKATVFYAVWVENKGNQKADGAFYVDVFYDSEEAPDLDTTPFPEGVHPPQLVPGGLEVGETIKLPLESPDAPPFEWPKAPPGEYLSWAVIDIGESIVEDVNRSNNAASLELTVDEVVPGLPNITILDFVTKVLGNSISYHIEIGNTGDKAVTSPFKVCLYVDREGPPAIGDPGDFEKIIEEMDVDEVVLWDVEWEDVEHDGEYKSFVLADCDGVIEEQTEGDNKAGPRHAFICSDCNVCENGVYLKAACICGDETVSYGYCCDGEYHAVGCTEQNPDVGGEYFAESDGGGYVVEFTPYLPGDEGCGCRFDQRARFPAGVILLLALLACLFSVWRWSVWRRES